MKKLDTQSKLLTPGIESDILNTRKIFILLVLFEAISLLIVYLADITYNINIIYYFLGIVIIPVLLFILPIEPAVGVTIMILTTGLDFLGKIAEASEESIVSLTYFHLALAATFIGTLLNLLFKRKITIPSTSLWAPIIAFLFMTAVSVIYTPDFVAGAFEFVRLVFMALLTVLIVIIVNTRWRLILIVWSMILIPFIISILSIYQLLTEGLIFSPIVRRVATDIGLTVYRATGTFSNPNYLGCFLMVSIVLAFGVLFVKKQKTVLRLLLLSSIAVTSVALMISFSRSSWLSTLTGLLVIVVLQKRWSFIVYFIIICIASFIILSITEPLIMDAAFSRFESIFDPTGDSSSSSRLSLIKSGIRMWQDNPILGVGAGGFAFLSHQYVDPNMPEAFAWIKESHTLQTKILAEQGLIGFTIAVWLFFTILYHGIRNISFIQDDFLRNAQIGLTALFIGFFINFIFSADPFNNIFWMTIGLIYAIPLIEKYRPSLQNATMNTA